LPLSGPYCTRLCYPHGQSNLGNATMSVRKVARMLLWVFTNLLAFITPYAMFVVFLVASFGYQDNIAYHVVQAELVTLLPLIVVGLLWIPILLSEKKR
jgi:hypothetical protein